MQKEMPLHVVFVDAWIKKDDKFLLARRSSKDDQAAGNWALPGGKVEMELGVGVIEQNLKRELLEEVGVEIEDNIQYIASKSFIRSSGHHVVGLNFLARYKSGEAKALEDQEEVKWMSLEEIQNLLNENENFEFFKDYFEALKLILP